MSSQKKGMRRLPPTTAAMLEALEPRQLLSAGTFYDVVGDYRDDYGTAGWSYLWNKPTGWTPSNSGTLTSGSVTDATSFAPLVLDAGTQIYTPAGASAGTDQAPAGNLRLSKTGGIPGAAYASSSTSQDRYAISALDVTQTGYYAIQDSYLRKTSTSGSDGIEVRVFVGSATGTLREVANDEASNQITPASGTNYVEQINFDTQPFFAQAGEKVYVAIGGISNANNDTFDLDYSVVRYNAYADADGDTGNDVFVKVTDYGDSFAGDGVLRPGWQYLWNAPTGWTAAPGVTGTAGTGTITDVESYQPLVYAGGGVWTPDGDGVGSNHNPDGFLRLSAGGGRPGDAGTSLQYDRYAIAAYTLPRSGRFALTETLFQNNNASSDGQNIRVFVNSWSNLVYTGSTPAGLNGAASRLNFDADLGYLNKNDIVYVVVGANGSTASNNDVFGLDYTIAQLLPRPLPLETLTPGAGGSTVRFNVTSYGATPDNPNDDDAAAIQSAINAARLHRAGNPNDIVEVFLANGTYHLFDRGTSDIDYKMRPQWTNPGNPATFDDPPLNLSDVDGLLFTGNAATLMLRNPTRRAFDINNSSRVILQGITIDFGSHDDAGAPNARLPFTQGTVTAVNNTNKTVTVKIDRGYQRLTAPSFQTNGTSWKPEYHGAFVDANIPGKLLDGVDNVVFYEPLATNPLFQESYDAATDTYTYVVPLTGAEDTTLDAGVLVNQKMMLWTRESDAHLISMTNTRQVTFKDFTVYAGGHMGIVGPHNDLLSLINYQQVVKPDSGRLMSVNSDGLHLPNSRGGVWLQDSRILGQKDDTLNIRSRGYTITNIATDGQGRQVLTVKQLQDADPSHIWVDIPDPDANGDYYPFQEGESVKLVNMDPGVVLGWSKIVAVNTANDTITLDRAISNILIAGTSSDLEFDTQLFSNDLGGHFYIADNELGFSRGELLIKSVDGQVVGNRVEGTSSYALQMINGPQNVEGFGPSAVTIAGNTFVNSGYAGVKNLAGTDAAIVIGFKGKTPTSNNTGFFVSSGETSSENFWVLNNRFVGWKPNAIHVSGSRRLRIEGNAFGNPVKANVTPTNGTMHAIEVRAVKGASITGNTWIDSAGSATVPNVEFLEIISTQNERINAPASSNPANTAGGPTNITLSSALNINENTPLGTRFAEITATGGVGPVTFNLVNSILPAAADTRRFIVVQDPSDRKWYLHTADTIDYTNDLDGLQLRLRAIDANGRSYTRDFVIAVNNVNDADNSLTARYRFNGPAGTGTGQNLGDSATAGVTTNPLTLINGATVSGTVGVASGAGSLVLNGVNQSARANDSADLNPTSSFTISTWFRPAATIADGTRLVQKGGDTTGYGLYFNAVNNTIVGFANIGGSVVSVATALPSAANLINIWQHVVLTYNGSALKISLNGSTPVSTDVTGSVGTTTSQLFLGARGGANSFFNGWIDDFRLYKDTALGDGPARALYLQPMG